MSNLNLMVGDWVFYEGTPSKMSMVNSNELPINIQPIPLSPEVIEKIEGIRKRVFNDGYIINGVTISFEDEDDGYWVCIKQIILKLQYLHQLQQLIRLFANKEIELKW